MKPFTKLTAVATPFYRENVDTDVIIPAEHLKTISRTGLGKHCFETVRYDADGRVKNSSPFDHGSFKNGQILIAGPNFGCGSSREHAVWALMDLGYSCVIAPSFADIFFGNAIKNGMLLIELPVDQVRELEKAATGEQMKIDLEMQEIITKDSKTYHFQIDELRKNRLLQGLDEIGLTQENEEAIAAFEAQDQLSRAWLYS